MEMPAYVRNGRLGPFRSCNAQNLRSLLLTVNEEGDWRALAIRSVACLCPFEGLELYCTTIEGLTLMKDTEFLLEETGH